MEKRRGLVRPHVAALIAAALCDVAQACELPGGARLESPSYTLAFRPVPEDIVVGAHFALEYAVCAKPGAAPPGLVGVDARMPAHRHGMNYRPSVHALGDGRFRAEGLLLHMPGQWQLIFHAGRERLVHDISVE